MTSETAELYRELIHDHATHPRHMGELSDATVHSHGHNPTCGDEVTIWIKLEGEMIVDASFKASGCSISMSSASMLIEAVRGKSIDDVSSLFNRFHHMLTGPDASADESLDKLVAFAGVRKFPIRVKCATLPWHTFKKALEPQMNTDARG